MIIVIAAAGQTDFTCTSHSQKFNCDLVQSKNTMVSISKKSVANDSIGVGKYSALNMRTSTPSIIFSLASIQPEKASVIHHHR